MRILVSGSKGLIGSHLVNFLEGGGHEVRYLSHTQRIEKEKLEGFDAIVHLWGVSIDQRWTRKVKRELYSSRVETTKQLATVVASLERPPKVFICASAVGIYGSGFLSDLCKAWEGACQPLSSQGIRVVNTRFGMVLSSDKGALPKMVKAYKWGFGGVFGTGEQYVNWVAIDDVVRIIYHVIMTPELSGPVDVVSPELLTNREFCKILAAHLHRPLGPRIPRPLLRLLKGQMADEVLLSSIRAEPKKLLESGYRFFYPDLKTALKHLIY